MSEQALNEMNKSFSCRVRVILATPNIHNILVLFISAEKHADIQTLKCEENNIVRFEQNSV